MMRSRCVLPPRTFGFWPARICRVRDGAVDGFGSVVFWAEYSGDDRGSERCAVERVCERGDRAAVSGRVHGLDGSGTVEGRGREGSVRAHAGHGTGPQDGSGGRHEIRGDRAGLPAALQPGGRARRAGSGADDVLAAVKREWQRGNR